MQFKKLCADNYGTRIGPLALGIYNRIGNPHYLASTSGRCRRADVKKLTVGNISSPEQLIKDIKYYKVFCVNSQNQTILCQGVSYPHSNGNSASPVGDDKTNGSICRDYSLQQITLKSERFTRAAGDDEDIVINPFQLPSSWCEGTVKWYDSSKNLIATLSGGQLSNAIELQEGRNKFYFTCTTAEGTCEMQNKWVIVK